MNYLYLKPECFFYDDLSTLQMAISVLNSFGKCTFHTSGPQARHLVWPYYNAHICKSNGQIGRRTRTGGGLADGGVGGAELEAVHTHTVEAAMSVDAVLCAGVRGGALVHIYTRLPIILQSKARVASALERGTHKNGKHRIVPVWGIPVHFMIAVVWLHLYEGTNKGTKASFFNSRKC